MQKCHGVDVFTVKILYYPDHRMKFHAIKVYSTTGHYVSPLGLQVQA